jgi:hypothetical protein
MAEPSDEPRGSHRRAYGDDRDDYDDEFGRVDDPRSVARRRIPGPAIAMIVAGAIGLFAALIASVGVAVAHVQRGAFEDDLETLSMLGFLLLIGAAATIFVLSVAGGVSMLQLRRRRLVLAAAYIVTGTSLFGFYGILWYPVGIWALIVLYEPEVWRQFQTMPRAVRRPNGRDER